MYGEQVEAVDRGDDAITEASIDGAIAEAKGYLTDYDVVAIFAATGSNRNALLLIFVKDIAVWHFVNLGSPGINYEAREARYKSAIAWLKGVQKGNISPDLPESSNPDQIGSVAFGSNPKRGQHF